MSLGRMILSRILASVWIFFLVTGVLFFALETLPGDYASASAPRFTTWEQIEAERHLKGLNEAPLKRYFSWLTSSLRGELGSSWYSGRDIASDLSERFGFTALLAGLAALMALPLGFAGGVIAVVCRGSFIDRIASSASLVAISMPEFLVAYALMTFFVVATPIFPAHVVFFDDMTVAERLHGMILPAASLAIIAVAPVLRQTRAALIGVMASPYVEQARLKGFGPWRIVLLHALPNALGPIINVTLLVIANFFVGAVIVEQIFSYPGIGSILISAVKFRDVPLVLALGLLFALIFISLNLLADIISMVSNPRLRDASAVPRSPGVGLSGLHPRRLFNRRRLAYAGLGFFLVVGWMLIPEAENYPLAEDLVEPAAERDRLLLHELKAHDLAAIRPVHFDYFKPVGESEVAPDLAGRLRVEPFTMLRHVNLEGNEIVSRIEFPEFEFLWISHGNVALPVQRDQVLTTSNRSLEIILSAGAAWRETADAGWTRIALPFTLLRPRQLPVLNGVATFALLGDEVTQMRVQIAQEGLPGLPPADWWGQADIEFTAETVPNRSELVAAWQDERATDFMLGSWSELEQFSDRSRLAGFDNRYIRRHVSASGLLVDETLYLRACPTRFGPHPYCAQLRHPVFSVSKSLGAGLAMLRLAQKYGPGVFDERILDYVPLQARHDGWKDVTFGDALNMATGIGELLPWKTDTYVEADFVSRESRIWQEPDVEGKLDLIAGYKDYPWGPGEIMRYKSSETMLLSIAIDRLLRQREGENYGLIEMMHAEIYQPLGVGSLPTRMMRDGPHRPGVPQYGGGMLPNIQQVAKLARLIANQGEFRGRQILHRDLSRRAIAGDLDRGLPTGSRYADGGEAHYDMSFWLAPFRAEDGCELRVPLMVGFGGNYVAIMPNGTIGIRFADGSESVDDTYDSLGIRQVSDKVRSFCG